MMTKRDVLVDGLKNNLMTVKFVKLNGDERVMNCTLHESILPEKPISGYPSTIKKKENKEVLSVWDIDKSGWRSFRLDSIKEFKVIKDML